MEDICQGDREHEIPDTVERWMRRRRLLNSRREVAEWKQHRRKVWVGKGCSQGGVLSHAIWCLVVDKLLRIITVIIADNQGIVEDLIRSTLFIVEKREVQLKVNPEKTKALIFTIKRFVSSF